MDLKDIREIVELMNEHDLSFFHLEKDDFDLKLKKGADFEAIQAALAAMPQVAQAPVAPVPVAAAPVAGSTPPAASPASAPATEGTPIESPMVGTFYSRPGPDQDVFVSVGDKVSEGQTICIIEAMKVMNEIKAEVSGTVSAIHVDDATPVQFGDTLFSIK